MQSEQINSLAEALALAQKGMTLPKKNREVTVKTNSGPTYKFEYTTLDAIIEHVRGPLTTNGLWFVQIIAHEDNKTFLDTSLVHTSGQWMRSRAQINHQPGGRAQEFGSALTYMRRYALSALLGIASEDDDDANTADGNVITERRDRPGTNGHNDPLPPLQRPKAKDPKIAAGEWVKEAEKTVNGFTRINDLRAWDDKNTDALKRLQALDIDLFDQINTTISDRFSRLNPANA